MVRRWPASVGEVSRKSSLYSLREWRSLLMDRVGIGLFDTMVPQHHCTHQALSAFNPSKHSLPLKPILYLVESISNKCWTIFFLEGHKRNLIFGRWGQLKWDAQWTHKLLPGECCVLLTWFFLWRNWVSTIGKAIAFPVPQICLGSSLKQSDGLHLNALWLTGSGERKERAKNLRF